MIHFPALLIEYAQLQFLRSTLLPSADMLTKESVAEMNDYQGRHNIWFLNYTRDSDIRRDLVKEAWKDYAILDDLKAMFARDYCNPTILNEAFENFSRVKSLEIRFLRCPFENEVLRRLWNIPGTPQAHRNLDSERLSDILTACKSLNLERFAHDRLSLDFFRQDLKSLMSQFSGLSRLKQLRLDLTHGAVEEDEFQDMLSKLSCCLRSLENLHTLHIGFKRRSSHSRMISPHIMDCNWRNLHTLHLSGITVSQVDLVAYLKRQASTLRNFEFGMTNPRRNVHLSSPEYHGIEITGATGKDFFTFLNQNLKLGKLDLRGTFNFKHTSDLGAYGEPDPSGEEDWNFEESTDMRSSLENFVVNGGSWPECLPQGV